jgi:hypothetical protein
MFCDNNSGVRHAGWLDFPDGASLPLEAAKRSSFPQEESLGIMSAGVPMKHMSIVVHQLKKERQHVQQQLQRIDEALAALGGSSNGSSRTMSAAGRRKISLAQKARWAKQKARGHAPKPKRTISPAGRRRIAAAQRARWAKVRRAA